MPKPTFAAQHRTALPCSHKVALSGALTGTPARRSETFSVTVIVRRKTAIDTATLGETQLTRAQYRARHAADQRCDGC